MKRSVFLLTLCIVVWTLGGCATTDGKQCSSESTFLASFSLGPILEANEQ